MKFRESRLAHLYLDGLRGIEIGGSVHNPFGLDVINVDILTKGIFKDKEAEFTGERLSVDLITAGDCLSFKDNSIDFVLTSHVLEHFPDPIKALKEWYRVIKPGGYLFMIVPHKERIFDKVRARTRLDELILRHAGGPMPVPVQDHHSVWITDDMVGLMEYLGWSTVFYQDVDDKVGNGFTVVVQKDEKGLLPSKVSNRCREKLFEDLRLVIKSEEDIEKIIESISIRRVVFVRARRLYYKIRESLGKFKLFLMEKFK